MASSLLQEEIEAANKKWMTAFSEKLPKSIGELYTKDCRTMPTGFDVIVGREGTSGVFKGAMDAGIDSVLLKTDEVGPMGAGDTAYEQGHYTFYAKDGSVADFGKYVVVWKKIEGTWYLDVDIWNSNKQK